MSISDPSPVSLPNRRLWNLWTKLHEASAFYDIESFRQGGSTLTGVEREEVGHVEGKSLLHLQCHFGLDTLSWARAGASVTGIDFSPVAIKKAEELARELRIDARFVCADLETLSDETGQQFDIVYTSFGVLSWVRDLRHWGRLIGRFLRPGGFFYMIEFHPVLGMFDDEGKNIAYSYFHERDPIVSEETRTYAGLEHEAMLCHQWTHSLADVINSLISAGLTLEFFHEFPYSLHPCYDFMIEDAPGRYVMRHHPRGIPMLFSIRATRPLR
jgi:SAM-dependent methyltransferase